MLTISLLLTHSGQKPTPYSDQPIPKLLLGAKLVVKSPSFSTASLA